MSKRHYAAISAITTYYRRIFTLLWKACLRRLSSPFSYCFFLPVHLFQLLFIICFLSLSIPLLIALLSSLLKLFPSLSLTISLLFGCLTYTILTFFSFFLMHSCFYLTFLSLMLIFLSLFLFSIYFYSSEYLSFSFIPIYLHIYVSLFLFSLYTIHLSLSLFSLFLFLSHSISLFCLFLCVSLSLSITLTCWSLCRIFSIPLAFYLPYSLYRFVQRFSSIPSSSSSTLPSVCPWPKPPKPMVFTLELNLFLPCFGLSALYSRIYEYCNRWPSPPAWHPSTVVLAQGSVRFNLREEVTPPSLYLSCCTFSMIKSKHTLNCFTVSLG